MDYSAALRRHEERYDALKAQLQTVGFIGQGSIQTRHLKCGKPTCRCYDDPDARHGPYHVLDAQGRRKDRRLEPHRRRTRSLQGVDREQP